VEWLGADEARVTARLPVEELAELFDVSIEAEDVETVGGLLAQRLGRVPIPGAVATAAGLRLTAESLAGRRNRIGSVRVERIRPDTEPDTEPVGTAVGSAPVGSSGNIINNGGTAHDRPSSAGSRGPADNGAPAPGGGSGSPGDGPGSPASGAGQGQVPAARRSRH
jgi:hypothetical protein